MSQSIGDIQSDIESTKDQINQTVQQINERLNDYKDWRSIVQDYPLPALGVAVGAGLIVSGLFGPAVRNTVDNSKNTIGPIIASSLSAILAQQAQRLVNQGLSRVNEAVTPTSSASTGETQSSYSL